MDPFVHEFQPDRYELWRAGLELGAHPEDDLVKLYPNSRRAAPRAPKMPQETHEYAV